jgi:hypothetical protein
VYWIISKFWFDFGNLDSRLKSKSTTLTISPEASCSFVTKAKMHLKSIKKRNEKLIHFTINCNTVKPLYNGHPWNLKMRLCRGLSKKVSFRLAVIYGFRLAVIYGFRLAVMASDWPLWLQTGRCWQVAVIRRWPLGQVWLYLYFFGVKQPFSIENSFE